MSASLTGLPNIFREPTAGQRFLDGFDLELSRGTNTFTSLESGLPTSLTPETANGFIAALAYLLKDRPMDRDALTLGHWKLAEFRPHYNSGIGATTRRLLAASGVDFDLDALKMTDGLIRWTSGSAQDAHSLSLEVALEGKPDITDFGLLGIRTFKPPIATLSVGRRLNGLQVTQGVSIGAEGEVGTTQLLLEFDAEAIARLKVTFSEIALGMCLCVDSSDFYARDQLKSWLLGRSTFFSPAIYLEEGQPKLPKRVVLQNMPEVIIRSLAIVTRCMPGEDFLGDDASIYDTPLAMIHGTEDAVSVDLRSYLSSENYRLRPTSARLLEIINSVWLGR